MSDACVFCDIIARRSPATFAAEWPDAVAIVPLNPVTLGHLLVIPTEHVDDAVEAPAVTGRAMRRAAEIARRPCNFITSAGRAATQTVFHLHIHVVPRKADDGLALPWSSGCGVSDTVPVPRAELEALRDALEAIPSQWYRGIEVKHLLDEVRRLVAHLPSPPTLADRLDEWVTSAPNGATYWTSAPVGLIREAVTALRECEERHRGGAT